jgi:hypothetical protein
MTEEERLKVLQTLAQGHLSVGQLIIENSGTNNYYDNRAVAGDGSTKTEEAIKRAVVRLMDEKDEKDDYIVYDQDQFYGIKAVLVSPLCGLPQKPAAFATALRNLGIDCLRIPYVYESIHPHCHRRTGTAALRGEGRGRGVRVQRCPQGDSCARGR